ncbi:Diphthamide biosynthesis protein 4 [Cladophialophora carrionii]|uniref:Diphthamide biosynthesis protein 4 n=1 Tax=Cladophialophora carrionii TaxID=86049 RepID=A0A1C1D1H2_9EURO|nr:Diphthamide biosynthesis protein 4 [Cladophialophora carrionii]
MSSETQPHSYYDVLRLSRHDLGGLSKDDIRAAYRQALLTHHPDKIPGANRKGVLKAQPDEAPNTRYTIDEIVLAFETLSDPNKRVEYDRSLQDVGELGWKQVNGQKGTHTGVEVYDLEDLVYANASNTWCKSCRCGDEQGYILKEPDLERESEHGELYVGCRGCSLFIKVQFAVEET